MFYKKDLKKIFDELPVVERKRGFVGLNIKVHYFPKPINDILWASLLVEGAFESWFGSLINEIYECIKEELPPLYFEGRNGGYWGFYKRDLEKEGLTPKQAIKELKKSLIEIWYDILNQPTVRYFNLGRDLDNENMIFLELYYNIKENKKYCSLDGVPQWCSFEKQINKYLEDNKYENIAKLFREFSIAWQYKDILKAA